MIGRATAMALAREGARVVIAARGIERGRSVLQELRALGADAEFVAADVSRAADVDAMISTTLDHYGRLDCAVNNAVDPAGSLGALADLSEAQFREGIATNLESVWLCMRAEIRRMRGMTLADAHPVQRNPATAPSSRTRQRLSDRPRRADPRTPRSTVVRRVLDPRRTQVKRSSASMTGGHWRRSSSAAVRLDARRRSSASTFANRSLEPG